MSVFLVRHAKAGDRGKWTDPDELRPLTKAGWEQAHGLVELLADEDVRRVVSSRYARCVQTVEPIAGARGLPVETDPALAEGAPLDDTLQLITGTGDGTILCTHGDVMENVIDALARRGVAGADPSRMKKGSTWMLERSDDDVSRATYVPPPNRTERA